MTAAAPASGNSQAHGVNPTLQASLAYLAAGLSVIPIALDGSKAPWPGGTRPLKWDRFKSKPATEREANFWWDRSEPGGIAVIGGRVSGNLEQIDFDEESLTIFPAWCDLVEAEAPGLVARLSVARTPREPAGYHVRYRCPEVTIPGNEKLASDPQKPGKQQTLIETRGEGGYAIAPGSPAACHETGRTWEHHSGPELHQVQTITAAEREILLRCARSFDRKVIDEPARPAGGPGNRPGDDFNTRGPSWAELLEPHGWSHVSGRYWRRPGKERGWSATAGVCVSKSGNELFAVFSSSASPFEGPAGGKPCSCYGKFAVYTVLNHGGDFSAAAKALAQLGYGDQRPRSGAGPNASGPSCREIIAGYLREHFRPIFKRPDGSFYSDRFARAVRKAEALDLIANGNLLDKLLSASDAPKCKVKEGYEPDPDKLPGAVKKWAPFAWGDVMLALDDEAWAEECSEPAQEDFRRLVAQALRRPINMGHVENQGNANKGEWQEARQVIQWAAEFGNKAGWEPARSYLIWARKDNGQLRVALHGDLFSQIGPTRLADMGHRKFSELARRYGVALPEQDAGDPRGRGGDDLVGIKQRRILELNPAFVAELLGPVVTE